MGLLILPGDTAACQMLPVRFPDLRRPYVHDKKYFPKAGIPNYY